MRRFCIAILLAATRLEGTPPTFHSTQHVFTDTPPTFQIAEPNNADAVRWQVSRAPRFPDVPPGYDMVQTDGEITIGEVATDSIEPETPYYLRAKTLQDDVWSQWSSPFGFSIIKKSRTQDKSEEDFLDLAYVKSPYVTQEIWESVFPYLLPETHPAKRALDKIFSASRATADLKELKNAGFKEIRVGKYSSQIVAKHPKVPGYLIKLYTDYDSQPVDWAKFKTRVQGANQIRESLDAFGYHDIFVVPHKWIYPLPEYPEAPAGSNRKNFVLIVEEIDILKDSLNLPRWKSPIVTRERLNALYKVLHVNGLWDSAYPFNIPFTKDGRNAFIDTEYYNIWPVKFSALLIYLNSDMKAYWHRLIEQGGPHKH